VRRIVFRTIHNRKLKTQSKIPVGVINAFTNAAQKLGPLQRIEMERFAGTLIEAPLN